MNWKKTIINFFGPKWIVSNNILSTGELNQNIFETTYGCSQSSRSLQKNQAGFYDWHIYKDLICSLILENNDSLVVDLGCGDGRFARYLLKKFDNLNIIAVESNLNDLISLNNSLNEEEKKDILLIHSKIEDISLPKNIADLVICAEVIYLLKDKEEVYNKIYSLLKNNSSNAMVSNISKESYYVHALLNNDIEQLNNILQNSLYIDSIQNDKTNFFPAMLLNDKERKSMEVKANLECIKREVISGFYSLLLHSMRQKELPDEKLEIVCNMALESKDIPFIPRISIDILKKISR